MSTTEIALTTAICATGLAIMWGIMWATRRIVTEIAEVALQIQQLAPRQPDIDEALEAYRLRYRKDGPGLISVWHAPENDGHSQGVLVQDTVRENQTVADLLRNTMAYDRLHVSEPNWTPPWEKARQ